MGQKGCELMNCYVAASSDIGNIKQTNQDSYLLKIVETNIGRIVFACLCDGMGGLEKGEVASGSVVNAFNDWITNKFPSICMRELTDDVIKDEWVKLVNEFNCKLREYGRKYGISVGTTLTAILITPKRYYIINVGDTRAYLLKNQIKCLTVDHTVIQSEIEKGNLTREDARNDPRRSVLLQCIGVLDSVYPDMYFGSVESKSVFLLCTDGFRHEISEKDIYDALSFKSTNNSNQLKMNINHLISVDKNRNERDNISALAIKIL